MEPPSTPLKREQHKQKIVQPPPCPLLGNFNKYCPFPLFFKVLLRLISFPFIYPYSRLVLSNIKELYNTIFEQSTRSTHFLFYFISFVLELWITLHCYHKNGYNVNHGQLFLFNILDNDICLPTCCQFLYSIVLSFLNSMKPVRIQ